MKRIQKWNVENEQFWNESGRRIAWRNLAIAVPSLLCAFAIWMYWSIIIVQMQNLDFPFSKDQLYTLTAIAGLSGATLRIPNSFLIALSGGRNVIAVTTALLLLPTLGCGIALRDPQTPYFVFAILAALSGFGGGAFASSMSHISLCFPKRMQGLALGLNAGLGNLGVSVMQALLPLAMMVGLFGFLGGDGLTSAVSMGGQVLFLQNAGLVWIPFLIALALLAWFGIDNLPVYQIDKTSRAIGKMLWLLVLGLVASGCGLFLLLKVELTMWLVLPLTIILTLLFMRFLTPAAVRANLSQQFVIFKEKHNWIMTWLYVMTFGSFIGYSAAFPKLIQDVFGYLPDGTVNPHAPDPMQYAWLAPLVGSAARPLGGWLSDKFGGARVTHWDTIVMIAAALGAAFFIRKAGASAQPDVYFMPFLALFLILFITTGIGNGSTFRMVPIIFPAKLAGPVLGWTSAIAAYGAFIIPKVFGAQIQQGRPEWALYGFTVYYGSCLALNWWFYARKNAEIEC